MSGNRIRDLWIPATANIDELAEDIAKHAEQQIVPVMMRFNEELNFGMVCSSALHALRHQLDTSMFDLEYIRDYVLEYYAMREDVQRRGVYITPEMEADLDVINTFFHNHYEGEIDQWIMRGDLFAKRSGKINLSFIIPLAIMSLHSRIQSLEQPV